MYRISITTHFRAGHQITVASATEPYHTHNWLVEISVGGEKLDENGMLFDFNKLKKILESIVCELDGRKLEDLKCFEGINTTAENVAKYIYDRTRPLLPKRISLLYVELTETPLCKARYDCNLSV